MSKTKILTMRISSEQLEKLIERIYKDDFKSKSEFIRSAINDKLKKKPTK